MPIFNAETKSANSVWKSPDGQREIFEVVLLVDGNDVKAKTYSNDISRVGFSGEIETYEKEGRNGSETFVKQAPKENAGYPQVRQGGSQSGGGSYQPRDDGHIKAQWAIGQAVGVLAKDGEVNLELVEPLAYDFFDMVDRVKTHTKDGATEHVDEVVEVTGNEMPEDFLKNIDEIFPGAETESKWPKS